jgi:multidrug resistance protein
MMVIVLTNACVCFTALSSAWGMSNDAMAADFHVAPVVAELGLSLYVMGLSAGSILAAPLSEFYGRQIVYFCGLVGFFAFQFGVAFGTNLQTIIISRFLQAVIGSVFMSNIPGTIADLFEPREMGAPMNIFVIGPFVGPGAGPVIAGFVVQQVGWRWLYRVFIIWTFVLALAIILLVPETYSAVLLRKKAKRLRKSTGDNRYYAPIERAQKSILEVLRHHSYTPIKLLMFEPMLFLLCFYSGFLLLVIYLFFVGYPLVFASIYGFELQYVGLAFLGVTCAMVIAACMFPYFNSLQKKMTARNNGVSKPEFRLPAMMFGSLFCPIGLFVFAWSAYSHVNWMGPIVGGGIFGFGCFFTFNGIQLYTVEAYRKYAASSAASNVFVRCMMAGAGPLFGVQMFEGMGVHWAMTFLALVSLALAPSAFLFYKYGETIRTKSKFAYS